MRAAEDMIDEAAIPDLAAAERHGRFSTVCP
jgi:hypothetical protein